MNANELKEYIIYNSKISLILERLGCHGIKEYKSEYRAALPNKTNKTAVTVKKNNLFTAVNSSDLNFTGDIFVLVMKLKNISFGKANILIHEFLGLEYSYTNLKQKKETKDLLDVFKKIKKNTCITNRNIDIYNESIFKEYTDLPHISWIKDGIMPFACKKFNIGYSFDKKRIIIPWRYWCGNENQYVGIVGRTTIPNYEELDIPKYLGIKPFSKGMNIYGLYENYQTIQQKRHAVIFESEKSVLKRYSRKDETALAIGSHSLSSEQVKILVGLNVDIIVAFDKDIDINEIRRECDKFYGIRNVYYIYDKWGILSEKESPADRPNKQYEFMLKYKIKYDVAEHKEFLKWVNEKQKRN